MTRALLLLLAVVGALLLSAPAGAFSRQDVTITSADGTAITATLTLPAGTAPASGWPAVIYMHGLGGNRGDMLTLAQTMGVGERYAVLAYDARGHGGSGGLIGIDGPKEIADVRAVFGWLRNRPDVADNRIGGWGVSYGGGAAWNSLVADVPWAALAISISWTDLRQALVPQGLAKTGVMAGFLGSLDPKRVDPEVFALRDAAFAGEPRDGWAVRGRALVAAEAEGRQDTRLHDAGPPRLRLRPRARAERLPRARRPEAALDRPQRPRAVVGRRGRHARDARRERAVVRPLPPRRHLGAARAARGGLARELARAADAVRRAAEGRRAERRRVPEARGRTVSPRAGATGSCSRASRGATEVFGSPTVEVTATARGGWSRIVAVLSARTPAGKEIVVAGGGVPTRRRTTDVPHLALATRRPSCRRARGSR